jgi:hypothetical protein
MSEVLLYRVELTIQLGLSLVRGASGAKRVVLGTLKAVTSDSWLRREASVIAHSAGVPRS